MYKTILQEFCQKYHNPVPVYDTKFIGGSPHQPQYKSTVTVKYNGKEYIISGPIKNNKKEAENRAGEESMKQLNIIVKGIS